MERRQHDGRSKPEDNKRSLMTERDIDPEFGLFTEDLTGGTIPDVAAKQAKPASPSSSES